MAQILRKIGLEKVRFVAPVGYFAEERVLKNTFLLDISVEMKISQTEDSENLQNTIDYSILHAICAAEFTKESQLIETVAQRILDQVIHQFPFVTGLYLRINKLNPPIKSAELRNSFVELNFKT